MHEKRQKLVFRISLLLCIISFVLVLFLGNAYLSSPSQMLDDAKDSATSQADDAAMVIGSNLSKLVTISESLADDLSSGELEGAQVSERLKKTMEENPDLFGLSAVYKPYAFDPEKRLYAPYYVRKDGELELIRIEDVYDYTLPEPENGTGPRTAWYNQTFEKGACWIEPYFGTAGGTFMINYNVVFCHADTSGQERVPAGIIGTEYSLDGIRRLVGSLDLGDTGYGFILTEKGTVVSHPIQEYLGENINDLKDRDGTLRLITDDITHGSHQVFNNEVTGQNSWVFYEPIPSTNWTLGVVFVEEEIFQESRTAQYHLVISLAIAVLAFLFFLSTLIFRVDRGSSANLWILVFIFSILCIIGMGFIWHLTLENPPVDNHEGIEIFDRIGLETALNKLSNNQEEPMIRIPTGVFLQSLEFSSANNVIVTGYVWQNYSTVKGDEISRGFILPEAESVDINEAYQDDNVTGWYFWAVLRQPFDYSKYPFDREDVWIRLWHKDFHRNIILTPDFDSYNVINPVFKPGLERDLVLEGWEIQNSYFSYRDNSYNSNFGVEERKQELPELYFNAGMKRDFLASFISDLIPITVVALLLFAVLLISTKSEEKISLYGFSSSTVLGYCAALFFVLIISHVSMRNKLAAAGIIYLEYFYFVLYFIILAVSVNSILLASTTRHEIIHYRDNLIIKLLYWPVLLGLLLLITLANFY